MKPRSRASLIMRLVLTGMPAIAAAQSGATYKIVDTGQTKFYNNTSEITKPEAGQPFYGQDAHYTGNTPSYTDNRDGTVTDLGTGLMWQKSPDTDGNGIINYADKLYFDEALARASSLRLAGYNDWRLPTIKELYSLIMFSGMDVSPEATSTEGIVPFIDTRYFAFGYGDLSAGERIIDAQFATSTIYVSRTMDGNRTMFGVNFADGRIKGYPADQAIGKKYYVLYVRGNPAYGNNLFVDNGDGTITDHATGLMWTKNDNGAGVSWESALSYAEGFSHGGYTDWRLPNAKELQSIVDYTRSPATTNSAAINAMFNCTPIRNEAGEADYPWYWSSTTHLQGPTNGASAAYVSFGRTMGYMQGRWIDVHGAGAQRSDPKAGNPADFPFGRGPQGDAIRIMNYVRVVRNAVALRPAPPQLRRADPVVNGATFAQGMSPGAFISIFGEDLAPVTRSWDGAIQGAALPAQLEGVSVTVGGRAAYLAYLSPAQLNVLLPTADMTGSAEVRVTTAQGSASAAAVIQRYAPGFFPSSLDSRYAAATHADNVPVAKVGQRPGVTSRPAEPGEEIVLWGTGFGPTGEQVPSGQVLTRPYPLADPAGLKVSIGGRDARVTFAGVTLAGVCQINVVVPPELVDGDQVVLAEIGGARTQSSVFIAVQRPPY